MELSDIIQSEENRIYSYVLKEKEFEYLDRINKEYFGNVYKPLDLYNFTLDNYNWLIKNGVINETKYYALKNTFSVYLTHFYKNYVKDYENNEE